MEAIALHQSEILIRAVQPEKANMSPEVARSILSIEFSEEDQLHMDRLAAKARRGTLSENEKVELTNYEQVNNLLGILKSKARRSLKLGSNP